MTTQTAEATAAGTPPDVVERWQHVIVAQTGRNGVLQVWQERPEDTPHGGRCGRTDGELWRGDGYWWARRLGVGVRLNGARDSKPRAAAQVGWLLVNDVRALMWSHHIVNGRRIIGRDGSILDVDPGEVGAGTAPRTNGCDVWFTGGVEGPAVDGRTLAGARRAVREAFGVGLVESLDPANPYRFTLWARHTTRIVFAPDSD